MLLHLHDIALEQSRNTVPRTDLLLTVGQSIVVPEGSDNMVCRGIQVAWMHVAAHVSMPVACAGRQQHCVCPDAHSRLSEACMDEEEVWLLVLLATP